MAGLTDPELVSWIENEEGQALGFHAGDLSRERELALDYYHGKLDVQAPEGRSDVVETDVRDTVDGMLPDLLDVFLSSDDVVKFEPHGPEDDAAAAQATDAVNYVFYRQNPGALILYEVFKAALLEKVGIFKFYHEQYSTPSIERYDGLNEVEFQILVNQPGVTVIEHSAAPDPGMQGMQGIQGMSLHDVRIRVVDPNGKICVHGVPSEEYRICVDHNSISLRDVRFFQHVRPLTVSAIRSMGIDVNPDESSDISTTFSPEYIARRRFSEEITPGYPDNTDPSQKMLAVSEISALVDRDGDGLAERRRIVKIGKTIYEDDYADHVPFSAICPTPMPYRFFGLSAADNAMTSQKTKSIIKRGMLDSLYFALNPRIGVMESMANLDDLLVSRPGGVVRFKTNPNMAWSPMEHRFVGQQAFPMLEYEDAAKENRTGFTRYSQGLDANALNKTATGISIISSASAKRAKLIARMFAETGVKDMMQGIKHLLKATRSGKPIAMRLRGQWVNVDPREWKTQWDMTVNVGLGTNDKAAQAAHIGQIMGVQKELRMAGMSHMVTDQNLYNSAKRLQETAGYKQEGEFFTPPSPQNQPPPPQPPLELLTKQMDTQAAQEKNASAERIKQMELMSGQAVTKMQQDTSIEVARINAAAEIEKTRMTQEAEAAREVFKAGNEMDLARQDLAGKEHIEGKKMEHQAQMEIGKGKGAKKPLEILDDTAKIAARLQDKLDGIENRIKKVKKLQIVRDKSGAMTEIVVDGQRQKVARDAAGNIAGID